MVWGASMPTADEAPEALPLGAEHAQQALELAGPSKLGPFGPRTLEERSMVVRGTVVARVAGRNRVLRLAARPFRSAMAKAHGCWLLISAVILLPPTMSP